VCYEGEGGARSRGGKGGMRRLLGRSARLCLVGVVALLELGVRDSTILEVTVLSCVTFVEELISFRTRNHVKMFTARVQGIHQY
jgi:hypothetical protein